MLEGFRENHGTSPGGVGGCDDISHLYLYFIDFIDVRFLNQKTLQPTLNVFLFGNLYHNAKFFKI